jgi:hypothetical protein
LTNISILDIIILIEYKKELMMENLEMILGISVLSYIVASVIVLGTAYTKKC